MKIACIAYEDISLGFGYVIAQMKRQGHQVKLFFDSRQYARGYARNKLFSAVLSQKRHILKGIKEYKPDICCFAPVTAHYQTSLDMAKAVKEHVGCKIVFGGIHATLVPEEVRKHAFIDDVVVGDGLEYFGGKFEPDTLWPDREIFFKHLPPICREVQLFMTSFGCPFNCTYCGNEQLRAVKQYKFIRRSVDGCIAELMDMKSKGAKYILFVDDILTVDKKWFLEFAKEYKSKINLSFCCFGHPKYLDEEIIAALASMRCHTVWIGIQSGDERLRRDVLGRPESNAEIVAACALIKKYKIKLMVDHIFGIPSENVISMDISQNLYEEIKPDVVNCYDLVYFPKAKIIESAIKYGNLNPDDIEKIRTGQHVTYQVGNAGKGFKGEYEKSYMAVPLNSMIFELLPQVFLKLIIHLRAGRAFIIRAVIENEVFYTLQAIRRLFTWK
jgi:radical SAM superfamily enzyme YgiQ (UPF0313 family)